MKKAFIIKAKVTIQREVRIRAKNGDEAAYGAAIKLDDFYSGHPGEFEVDLLEVKEESSQD